MKPLTREEQYLNRLTGEYEQTLPEEPITRKEQYLSRLCGADNIIPQEPLTREEQFLANLCGEEVDTPEPLTRLEQYMAFAGGESETKPASPLTRQEKYWDEYQGGAVPEEKTLTGNPVTITDALAQDALSLQVSFTPTQDGTPSIDSEPTTEPYLSKLIPRGNKEYYSLVGGTVARNQLIDFSQLTSTTVSGVTITVNADNSISVSGTASADINYKLYELTANRARFGHKFFLSGCPAGGSTSTYYLGGKYIWAPSAKVDYGNGKIIYDDTSQAYTDSISIRVASGTVISTPIVFRPRLIDLTLMFANEPAIADYIYTLEQSEAGSGIAWLKSYGFFTKDYYPYNEGELISVKTSGHKIGSTTYPIDPTDLRGLFKLSNGKLYCEGDTYKSDGTVTRKYGIVDLGTLTYTKYLVDSNKTLFRAQISDIKPVSSPDIVASIICAKYPTVSASTRADKTISIQYTITGIDIIDNSYDDADTFKTAMSGQYLVYELATPTTESATPYTSPIDVEAGGTEEFIDNRTVPIPVGNETYYASEYEVHGKAGVTVSHGATEDDPNPTEYEVEFTSQGTVYGGTVDIVSGVLSVTWAILSNPQNLHWITNSSQGMKNFQTESGTVSKKSGSDNWKCSRYSNGFIGTDKTEGIFIFDSGEVCIRDYRYWEHGGTSAEEAAFKASLADVTIAYELATLLTYQLTAQQVQMLLGDNYLVTEDGTITVTYMAKAAERVRAMNAKLNQNKQTLALKKAGSLGKGDLK